MGSRTPVVPLLWCFLPSENEERTEIILEDCDPALDTNVIRGGFGNGYAEAGEIS